MLVNKPKKSILILEKNKDNYRQIILFATWANPNYSRSGKVTVIEMGMKNESTHAKMVWHKNLSERVHGESIQALNSFLVSLKTKSKQHKDDNRYHY